MNIDELKKFALSLPEVSEAAHFESTSFRIRGKIIATLPPDHTHLHAFVDKVTIEKMIKIDSRVYEKLWRGKKVWDPRAKLADAPIEDIKELLRDTWRRKAPKTLLKIIP